jgi:hypothetical protein
LHFQADDNTDSSDFTRSSYSDSEEDVIEDDVESIEHNQIDANDEGALGAEVEIEGDFE